MTRRGVGRLRAAGFTPAVGWHGRGLGRPCLRHVTVFSVAALKSLALICGCTRDVPDEQIKTPATVRAEWRAYDGAPPVIPHPFFGMACISCHTSTGMEVPGTGFAPPMPHEMTGGISAIGNCRQCHVFRESDEVFVANDFVGLRQDLRPGARYYGGAPPVMPHPVFMRENCLACHSGPAAREEIRTSHPERVNCRQCHVPAVTREMFDRPWPIDSAGASANTTWEAFASSRNQKRR
jgi:nitrate reductase cytochrome c-type subunit